MRLLCEMFERESFKMLFSIYVYVDSTNCHILSVRLVEW